ncbi:MULTISPECIES: pilus assembly PilX family protein [unclassified Cupriavidus]|uniref:pilus assembly PilX family protein n=1 Tax=unclassified Cupriavidus TaxID=2640874 RepID=UPI00313D120E
MSIRPLRSLRSIRRRQRGISLVMVLLFLVILTLVGVAASMSGRSAELMSRNARDENVALQAAESALRDARQDIGVARALPAGNAVGASPTCDWPSYKGYCTPASLGEQPRWEQYIEDPLRSVELGEITALKTEQKMPTLSAGKGGGVSRQPRYIIERLPDLNNGGGTCPECISYVYRITAVGYGTNTTTRVMVQEVVRF